MTVRVYLEDGSVATYSAGGCSAVEVAAVVPNHRRDGPIPIAATSEVVGPAFRPSAIRVGRKLEYGTLAQRAALVGRTVDIAIPAESWMPDRISPVRLSGKAVKDSQLVVSVQFENHSAANLGVRRACAAAEIGIPVKIASTVFNQSTGAVAICRPALEGMEDRVVAMRIDLE